jgi:4-hydroxythreonine-4-phosphate dehydrogenase
MVLPLPLLLTMGDPAGIGPEIAARAWLERERQDLPAFAYVGDPDDLNARAAACGLDIRAEPSKPETAAALFADALPVIAVPLARPSRAGRAEPANAPCVIKCIETAVALIHDGRGAGLVTNPIHKAGLYGAGFDYPGHTEFLGALAHEAWGKPVRPVMMLACDELRVVPVTIHIPLAAVPGALTRELIVETGRIVARELKERFAVAAPRLALSGLNPHAGEDGALGSEERTIIAPAIARLRADGIDASGPYPADALFYETARARYDAALAMYHDQALIPIKTLAFDRAVNVTLGLPFVRTSPDHGTAFDIAGTGRASPTSLIEAIKLAGRLADAGGGD